MQVKLFACNIKIETPLCDSLKLSCPADDCRACIISKSVSHISDHTFKCFQGSVSSTDKSEYVANFPLRCCVYFPLALEHSVLFFLMLPGLRSSCQLENTSHDRLELLMKILSHSVELFLFPQTLLV